MADLAGLSRHASEAGIFCDFDGSLASIVADPRTAKLVPGASRVLASLAKRYAVVAVISGRAVLDLAKRVRVSGVRLMGLHGLEEVAGGGVTVLPEAEDARAQIERAAETLHRELRGVRGAWIEHKGLALAVHTRRAADPVQTFRLARPAVARIAAENGLVLVPGRHILELRPTAGGDKGSAVRRVVEASNLHAALVAGDDTGDLPAFDAVADLDVAVRVAVASDEAPPELTERADVVVASPQELVELLKKVLP
jgi:trehalose 6-phosphate phosphatase